MTLPDSADAAGLAWQIANSVKWWKKFDLAEELDNLYEKVLQTTELYKSAPNKIRIDFRENLHFTSKGSASPFSTPAAYFPERKTIYAVIKKVTREVMAHEMTHAALHLFTGMRLSHNVDEAALPLHIVSELRNIGTNSACGSAVTAGRQTQDAEQNDHS